MHKDLLSENERRLLNDYLASGKKGEGFRLLKFRMSKYHKAITKDLESIEKAQKRLSEEAKP